MQCKDFQPAWLKVPAVRNPKYFLCGPPLLDDTYKKQTLVSRENVNVKIGQPQASAD